ncbi:hypothetical protein A8H40_01535 [Burkholderia multivorans]|uniref:Uncharacterized protein n=1 Tax=Burkholderia multivorans CGD2 TaxID=513052 RepID=B9BLS3_9BURK|nr:hypothetical protein A8H40_01535 [Burkholderia multivorans]EEE08890.1 hypothetical protein BURMUCGD2_6031 [Burkholderia multivorans CGD2]EEE16576.1 hypothetical protein BURMUCGD2M_6021 [Burkholderia multivorans CGD2M]PRD86739.1 hypothetical protein C6P76_14805 [Burkholderia multivorans]PRE22325.1 hypothetical protein C6P79_27060 [Burkholderia multivorans]
MIGLRGGGHVRLHGSAFLSGQSVILDERGVPQAGRRTARAGSRLRDDDAAPNVSPRPQFRASLIQICGKAR